jgi:DNA-binding NtrC family response regulator
MHGVGQRTPVKKLLIVEDSDYLRLLMAEMLGSIGLQIESFPTADDGYSFLENHYQQVAILVTDIRLPGRLDGVDLAKRVTSQWPHIGVVLTSGYVCNVNLPGQFLEKPWSIDQLQGAVLMALETNMALCPASS